MNILDYFILGTLIIGFILGYKDGIIRKIVGLIGLFLGIFLAIQFSPWLGGVLSSIFNNEAYLAEIISAVFIFFGMIALFSLLKRIIHPVDKVNKFLNQFLGGIIGSIQMAFFISALFLLLNIFSFPSKSSRENSSFYTFTYSIIPVTIDFVLGEKTEAKDFLRDYIESKEDSLSI